MDQKITKAFRFLLIVADLRSDGMTEGRIFVIIATKKTCKVFFALLIQLI